MARPQQQNGTSVAAMLPNPAQTYDTGLRKLIITLTVIVSAMLELIDTTIVNVAITQISGNLGASIEDVSWVVTSYAIANVIVIPLSGFLGNLLGRRNYYIGSILLFTLASLFCGLATDIWALVFFRFIQGLGGGALLPTSQAILYETYRPEERGKATGIFSMGLVLGPTIGPLLGGYLVDYLSWEWCFFVNIPVGLLAAWSSYTFLKEPKVRHAVSKIDWTGIGLLAVGIGSLQFILERGQSKDWFDTPYITFFTFIAVAALLGFVWWELHTKEPAVDLRVLARSKNLAIAAVLTFIVGYGLYGSLFVFPVFVQRLLGFTAVLTGTVLFPSAMVTGIISLPLGIAMQRGVSPKKLMAFGMAFTSALNSASRPCSPDRPTSSGYCSCAALRSASSSFPSPCLLYQVCTAKISGRPQGSTTWCASLEDHLVSPSPTPTSPTAWQRTGWSCSATFHPMTPQPQKGSICCNKRPH
jgi:DHA2 family multidrug resistance protein